MPVAPQISGRAPWGLPGATAPTRYVGATASGAPASGTFAVGDFSVDQTGEIWVCTAAGSPGTWTNATTTGGISNAAATAIASGTGGVSGDTTIATDNIVRMTVGFSGATTFTGPVTSESTLNTQAAVNILGTISGGVSTAEPILSFWSDKNDTYADYQIGLDVANSVNGDLYIGKVSSGDGSVADFIYCKNVTTYGTLVGIGVTPPLTAAVNVGRLQVSAQNGTAGHAIISRIGAGTTGDAFRVIDSTNNILFSVSSTGVLSKDQNGIHVQAIANNGRLFVFDNVGGTASYGLYYPTNGGATFIRFRYFTGGQDIWTAGANNFVVSAPNLGFYNGSAVAQGSITGALSSVIDANAKAVLTSIITALTNVNLVSNGTT